MIRIAIDGPSGAGKSTLAKRIAKDLEIIYVDTGALYRSVGLYMQRAGIESTDREKVEGELRNVAVELRYIDGAQHVFLCGEDVGDKIRTNIISKYASDVSAMPRVREFLLNTQRSIAEQNSVIMDGRDIGTVIMPNADVKIFLTASAQARASRRVKELLERGEQVSYEETLAAIIERDKNDSSRDIAPAVAAPDAVILDNSEMNFEQTVEAVKNIIKTKGFEA